MSSDLECPYCASCKNKLISNFYSAVLNAKTTVYQCEQCLNLFNFPHDVKKSEFQKRLADLQQDAEERTAVAVAAKAVGVLNNQELATTIARIQGENLTAQLDLICQQITIVNPRNEELLDELEKQKTHTQIELIELQRQELQRRLNDLQEDAEEQISIAAASNISIDTGNESQTLVVVYGYDSLMNRIPVDSFWTDPNNFRYPNLEPGTLINVETSNISGFNSVPHLLKLFFGIFQIFLGSWLLCLAFSF